MTLPPDVAPPPRPAIEFLPPATTIARVPPGATAKGFHAGCNGSQPSSGFSLQRQPERLSTISRSRVRALSTRSTVAVGTCGLLILGAVTTADLKLCLTAP